MQKYSKVDVYEQQRPKNNYVGDCFAISDIGKTTCIAIVPESYINAKDNAERLASCWNACQSFENPEQDIKKLIEALKEISLGQGRYSLDPLTHASNTIDDMKQLANDALALAKRKGER